MNSGVNSSSFQVKKEEKCETKEEIVECTFSCPFPDENLIQARKCNGNESIMIAGHDRRRAWTTDNISNGIGRLIMEYGENKKKHCFGTGCVFHVEPDCFYIATAAHNIVRLSRGELQKANHVWFEFRENYGNKSRSVKKFEIDKRWIYDGYADKPEIFSGKDFAVVRAIRPRPMRRLTFVRKTEIPCKNLTVWDEKQHWVYIVGFPGEQEKKGQLWGMRGRIGKDKTNDELINYTQIDTTDGQSGSPVISQNGSDFFGVHNGYDDGNIGTYIDMKKMEWVNEIVFNNLPECDGQTTSIARKLTDSLVRTFSETFGFF